MELDDKDDNNDDKKNEDRYIYMYIIDRDAYPHMAKVLKLRLTSNQLTGKPIRPLLSSRLKPHLHFPEAQLWSFVARANYSMQQVWSVV